MPWEEVLALDTLELCQYLYDGLVGYQRYVHQQFDSIIDSIKLPQSKYRDVLFLLYDVHMGEGRQALPHVDEYLDYTQHLFYHHYNL